MDICEIQTIINTNVTAVMVGCKEAISSMKRHDIKDGHVININRYGKLTEIISVRLVLTGQIITHD